MSSIAEVKAELNHALSDDMDRMIAAALDQCRQRIARLTAAMEGTSNSDAEAMLSVHLMIAQSLEQAQGGAGNGRGAIESLAGRL